MVVHNVSGTFSGVGSLAGLPSGIKRIKGTGATPDNPVKFSGVGSLSLDLENISYKRNIEHTFRAIGNVSEDQDLFLIERSQVWWDKSYLYRRVLQLQPTLRGVPQEHPLQTIIGRDVVRQNKVRSDYEDIEVLRLVSFVPETWEILPKHIEVTDSFIKVSWPNSFEIPAGQIFKDIYYVYYGNYSLANKPIELTYDPPQWPVSAPHTDGSITYTRPGEHWDRGITETPNARATFIFDGSRVRIMSDIGNSWGIFEVQIDDNPWELVDLYNPQALEEQEVYAKEGLSVGQHTIRIRATGNSHPSASSPAINFKKIEYKINSTFVNLYEEADETLMWGSAIGGVVG